MNYPPAKAGGVSSRTKDKYKYNLCTYRPQYIRNYKPNQLILF